MNAVLTLLLLLVSLTARAEPGLPPPIDARAWLLLDAQSGRILAERAPDSRIEPASLTKLMTAYIAFAALAEGRLSPTQRPAVSEQAWRAQGARMYLDPGRPATVDELLKGLVVQSSNDAAIVLAEAIAGSQEDFAQRMNATAKRLGLTNTHFVNATGLPHPEHYTTARDLALLTLALIRDFPEYYRLFALREYTYNGIPFYSRNRLLWIDPSVDGVKTGHTPSAGYCLIASGRRGERRLISVVLGAKSDAARAMESLKLLNYGFEFFETARLYAARQTVARLRIYKGADDAVKAGFLRDFFVTVPRGSASRLKAQVIRREPLLAPVRRGEAIAWLRLSLDGRPVGDYPLVALEGVPVASLIGRAWDSLLLLFK